MVVNPFTWCVGNVTTKIYAKIMWFCFCFTFRTCLSTDTASHPRKPLQIIYVCKSVVMIFLSAGCHWLVDPEPYYQDCLYDLCSCQTKVSQCLCPIFSAYAKECTHKGIMIDWRSDIRECGKISFNDFEHFRWSVTWLLAGQWRIWGYCL